MVDNSSLIATGGTIFLTVFTVLYGFLKSPFDWSVFRIRVLITVSRIVVESGFVSSDFRKNLGGAYVVGLIASVVEETIGVDLDDLVM